MCECAENTHIVAVFLGCMANIELIKSCPVGLTVDLSPWEFAFWLCKNETHLGENVISPCVDCT